MKSFAIGMLVFVVFILILFATKAKRKPVGGGSAGTAGAGTPTAGWVKGALPWAFGLLGLVAIPIGDHYLEPSLFWKLLLGGGLMWGGKKLATSFASAAPAKVWGNILRGLGGVIIILALIKSGVGLIAEKTVNLVDETLTEVATGKSSPSGASDDVELAERDIFAHKANFLGMPVGHEILIKGFRPNQQIVSLVDPSLQHILNAQYPHIKGVKVLGVCARVIRPRLPEDVTVKFKVDRGLDTNTIFTVMADESRVMSVKNGYDGMSMDVIVTLIVKGVGPEICANTGK